MSYWRTLKRTRHAGKAIYQAKKKIGFRELMESPTVRVLATDKNLAQLSSLPNG